MNVLGVPGGEIEAWYEGCGTLEADGESKQILTSERLPSVGQRLDRTRRAWAEDQLSGLWECFQSFILTASHARTSV